MNMDARFPDQREDQPSPTSGTAENADASTVKIEDLDSASQSVSVDDKVPSVRSFLRGSLRAVTSQDYIGVLIATVVLIIGIGIIHPDFLAINQIMDILSQATFVAILACGMAFLLSMRELDLSVGSIYGLTSMCAALLIHAGMPSWFGALTGLVIGALLGLTNGLLIQIFRLPSIIATLATLSIYRGLVYRFQGIQQEFKKLLPNVQVLGPFDSKQEPQANYDAWSSLIKAHSNALAYLGVGDADNASLARLKQAQNGKYLTAAFDLNPTGLQAVQNGVNYALVDPEHFLKGYVAMRLLIEHALHGTAIPKGWWNPGAQLVTQANVAAIIAREVSLASKGVYFQSIIDKEFANPAAQIKPYDQAK